MKIVTLTLLCPAACLLWAGFVGAQEDAWHAEDVSRALGVQSAQFSECLKTVSPAVQPERPSHQQIQTTRRNLLNCLQKANPDLTGEQLDEAMRRRHAEDRT